MPESPEYLTYEEAADLMRVSVNTLRHWRKAGTAPPAFHIGKRHVVFKRADVEAFIEAERATHSRPSKRSA